MTSSIDANGAQTNYTYDNMGRRLTQTNPFPQGGTPGPVTSYGYDQLSRAIVTTLPDGNAVQMAYIGGNIVQSTDQVNRKNKRESDSLGRLTKVTEQDVTTGNLTQETTYTYDIADHLIGLNQGNQTRAFKYDAEGHVLFERIPEMTAIINDGTGTYWTTKYTYTTFGAVATKTDARGVIITYGYDNLNRLSSISYNTSGATGVSATNNVAYNYDTSQSSATNGLLLSITMTGPLATYTETFSYDDSKRVSSRTRSRDGQSYTTSYQYNTGNQLTQMVYPISGRTLNITHDSVGRVSQVADQYRTYISNFSFNSGGQVTGLSLGSVASETYGYDANRLQLTSQTATQTGGPSNGLMNLHYYYQALAGQTGAGSTPGNSGQLMAINNNSTINGTAESAAYTYDDLGRLVTSNQTSNGSSAQRRFDYDRWGNRTGMWNATSGGSQIQSIALQQSGGAPTNQIASVSAGKSTQNYVYDANGNLTNDGVHAYDYDAENRLKGVDGGATAAYAYDYQNRRIKKVAGGTSTHYVWEGSQVIAEHDATTGGVIYNYVYSGSRLIARMGSGVINWYLSDRLSGRLVLDVSGNVVGRMAHLPFGEDFGESGSQEKHHLTGYERDGESGLDYAVNRNNSPTVGRFQQADPYKPTGYIVDPQSWNRYTYVGNDPVTYDDPLGLNKMVVWIPRAAFEGSTGSWWEIGLPDDPSDSSAEGGVGQVRQALPENKEKAAQKALTILAAQLKMGVLNNGDCKTKVLDKLSTIPGFSLDKFATYLGNGGTFFDGTKTTFPIAGNITTAQAALNPPFAPCTTIDCFFKPKTNPDGTTSLVTAATSILTSTLTVYFNPDYIDTGNGGENSDNFGRLFHEGLHGFGGSINSGDFGDNELEQLLLNKTGVSSSELTKFIKDNCFKD